MRRAKGAGGGAGSKANDAGLAAAQSHEAEAELEACSSGRRAILSFVCRALAGIVQGRELNDAASADAHAKLPLEEIRDAVEEDIWGFVESWVALRGEVRLHRGKVGVPRLVEDDEEGELSGPTWLESIARRNGLEIRLPGIGDGVSHEGITGSQRVREGWVSLNLGDMVTSGAIQRVMGVILRVYNI